MTENDYHYIDLLSHQEEFLHSTEKFVLLQGGVGSGKTFSGAHYIIKKNIEDGGAQGLICANTYSQLHRSTLNCLFIELDRLSIPFTYKENKKILRINGGMPIICYSLENYEMMRGFEIGYCWMDESRDTRLEAFLVVIGRLRDKRSKLEMRLTSSPAGFDWQHEYFHGDKKTNEHRVIKARSTDNPFLPDGYIDTMRQNYDKLMQAQEIDGENINISQGRVYYAFDRNKHVSTEAVYNPNLPILIGVDFNINPLTATLSHLVDGRLHTFAEIFIMSSNTDELASYIVEQYGKGHRVIPDSTGKRKQTSSAGLSDLLILQNHGLVVENVANPFRVDRYNCVNNAFEKGNVIINTSCKELIKDLEQVSYKKGTNIVDESDPMRVHISDGFGYKCNYIWPFVKVMPSRVQAWR